MVEARRRSRDRQRQSEAADSARTALPATQFASQESGDAVAKRAHELYERRGGEHGRDWNDWFQAEQEIRDRGK